MMRGTIHVVSAKDYAAWRGPLQPILTEGMRAIFKARKVEMDLPPLLAAARKLLLKEPQTFDELRAPLV